jgi:hypothetical protein
MPECEICHQNFPCKYGYNNHKRIHKKNQVPLHQDGLFDYFQEADGRVDDYMQEEANLRDITPASFKYIGYQREFCAAVYGPHAYYVESWEDFVTAVLNNQRFDTKLVTNAFSITRFAKDASLTLNESNKLVKLIHNVSGGLVDSIPRTFKRAETLSTLRMKTDIPFLSSTVEFPERWMMDRWLTGSKPSPAVVEVRDPIACIAQQFIRGKRGTKHIYCRGTILFFNGLKSVFCWVTYILCWVKFLRSKYAYRRAKI